MTRSRQNSTWEEPFDSERKRQVANQGGAHDAARRIERHQHNSERNPNRMTVSSYSRNETEQGASFNAVAPGNRDTLHGSSGLSFGERNARATWSSSANEGFPRSRNSTSGNLRNLVVPLVVIIVVFVLIALLVRTLIG